MITKVFTVYDSKALFYGVPFFMPTVGGAVRAFSDVCSDPQSMIYKHPGDFSLYEIGEFDDQSGQLVAMSPFKLLGHGSDFAKSAAVVKGPGAFPSINEIREVAADAVESNGGSK